MISIIIPVKNDRRVLDTLKGVLSQNKIKDFEVIVVDASNGRIDDIKNMFGNRVRWIQYKNSNDRKRTTVAQINLGVSLSKGNIIVYLDADCVPAKNWLFNLTSPLIYENEYFVAGFVKSSKRKTHRDNQWEELKKYKYVNSCANMNSAIRKELLKKVGRYDDTSFNYGWDVDYSWRAINAGYRIRFVSTAVIYHDWGNIKSELKRSFHYGESRARLYNKNLNKIRDIFSSDPIAIIYPILILSLLIIIIYPYYSLIFIVLILNNINKKNPFIIVLSHFAYGFGVLKGIVVLIKDKLKFLYPFA